MDDWLHSLAAAGVGALVVLGPNPYGTAQDRQVLAAYPLDAQTAAYALAHSHEPDAGRQRTGPPLVALLPLSAPPHDTQSMSWQAQWLERGVQSAVRVRIVLPANRCFECFLFTRQLLTHVDQAAPLAWSALAHWPALRAALVAANSPLTPRELQCLVLAFDGLTARASAERMACAERTVNFHLANAMSKLKADNKVTAIQRACWLGAI